MIDRFSELNIGKSILSALDDAGFEHPTPIQEAAFPVIRSGRDMIGIAQTGTGKTLAYLMPVLMKLHYAQGNYPRALVVVPTRELVVQVCESIELLTEYMDIRSVGIYGGTNIRTQQDALYAGCDILVATPGRFMDIYLKGIIRTSSIRTVVIDEADRLMDMGFIPQLRAILDVVPAKHQTLLFSATFSDKIADMAEDFLRNPARVEVAPQATPVENIRQLRYDLPNVMSKINFLKVFLADREVFSKVIVFTETKKNADRIIEWLAEFFGDEIGIIHSNKAQNTRLNALNTFRSGKSRILIATDVAARGVDIDGVTHVVNFDIPSLPEEYVHRIGRTGRAGNCGESISLVSEKEVERFEAIERLINRKISAEVLPDEVEISDVMTDEEKLLTANIRYDSGHGKHNSQTPGKRRGRRNMR